MSLRLHGDTVALPGMLDFAVNLWPGPRPVALEEALQDALVHSHGYPDERAAKEAVAERHGRTRDEVLLVNGAGEAFWLLAQTFRPARAACIHPSFTEPEAALRAAGSEILQVAREHERWTFAPDQVAEEADFVMLGNPNNPTGTLDPPEAIIALTRRGRLLVVDESFIDFVAAEGASLARRRDVSGLVVVRSLTKLWSLAGIRAGYVLAPPDVIERLAANRQPWSVNTLACAAIETSARDFETPTRVATEVASMRSELVDGLRPLPGLRLWPSEANFLLLQVGDGPRLVAALRRRNIAVRPAASFPGLDHSHIRIAVRGREDNKELVAAFSEILS